MRLNDLDFHVEVDGHADGAPLLLLHGFTGSTRAWDDVRQRLLLPPRERAAPLRLILIDVIGHGRSEAPEDATRYGMEPAARDLATLLDQLRLPAVHLLGYSMGGRLALAFAVQHPARLHSLILESASPGIEDAAQRAVRAHSDDALADSIERDGLDAFVAAWERQPLLQLAPHVPAEVRETQHALRLQSSPRGLANSLRGMGTGRQPSFWADLPRLRVPALLLSGELDTRYSEVAERMARLLPRAERHVLRAAGHTAHVDQPAEFASLVADHVARTATAAIGEPR